MKLYRNIKLSRKTLLAHKLRTFLALLGITIGVATVILMIAIGKGAQSAVLQNIKEMGDNLLVVNAGQVKKIVSRRQLVGNVTTLVLKDYQAISDECPSIKLATPTQSKALKVKYGNITTMTTVLGTTNDFRDIRNFPTTIGRFFNEEENKAMQRVAVLGTGVQNNLFENEDPLGETIRIGNIPFKVIGVLKSKGVSPDGADQDNQIIIPINTALRRVFNLDYIRRIFVKVEKRELMDAAAVEIRQLLRDRHRLERRGKADDFTIQNQVNILEAEKQTSDMFTMLIAGIAAISLFVGGIGILAIMLLSIKERINEIGLRMATGARPKDILVQFISEALILGMTGSCLGVIIGITGVFIVQYGTAWQALISYESLTLSLSFSLSIALIFGVYPARKASLMHPIDALRAE